jgi:hypothetical protein
MDYYFDGVVDYSDHYGDPRSWLFLTDGLSF